MQKRSRSSVHVLLRQALWTVLLQYGIDGRLLTATKSLYILSRCTYMLYMHSEVCVRVNSVTTKPSRLSVELRQGCYMDRIVVTI